MRVRLIAIVFALTLTMLCLSAEPLCAEDVGTPAAPYDVDLYELGYDVFLANGNSRDAFLLAEKAVATRPNDAEWRRRAARSGEWSGNFAKALEHWFFLATALSDQNARQQALRLARELRDHRKIKLLLEPELASGDEKVLREYVSACELLGEPEDAIKALEPHRRGPGGKFALEQLAHLHEAVGQPEEAIAALLELVSRHNGVTAPILLKAASLAYGRGDLLSAYTIMNLGRKKIPPSEHEYWAMLGDLDWAMQNAKAATQDARVLIGEGKGRVGDYQRLIEANRDKDGAAVYDLALEGWRRFKNPSFLLTLLESGIALNRHGDLLPLLREAGVEGDLKPLEENSYYWTLLSVIYREAGNYNESLLCYREAIHRSPDNGALLAGYVWLLLDLDRRKELQDILQAWKGRERYLPELNDPFGAAYAFQGDNYLALRFYQARYRDKHNDPTWLAAYADLLEQTGRPETAFQERLRALRLTRERIKAAGKASDAEAGRLIRDYVRLAMHVEPGDVLDAMMQKFAAGRQDDTTRELVAAWALSTERSDFARLWYLREYAAMTRHSRWVELALALEENDRPALARLVSRDVESLPYRDAIEAAQRAGMTGTAETMAFERFQENGQDYLLDQQVREIFAARPDGVSYRLSLMDLAGVGFLEQRIALSSPLTSTLSLLVDAGNTDIRHLKTGILGMYPSSAQSILAGVTLRHERGAAELSAGIHDGLAAHPVARALAKWRVDSHITLDLALQLGAEATESVPLQVGGMKDEASIAMLNSLTSRDAMLVRLSGRSLLDQERRGLGEGASFESELTHRLLINRPDANMRLFGGYHYYVRTGTPTGKAFLLIPPERSGDTTYFVPSSFFQTGIGMSAGQDGRTSYSRQWSPFGSLDLIWNSVSGTGFRYELGLAGPIFGLDKMELSASQESGAFGYSDLNTRMDLRYRYYFR